MKHAAALIVVLVAVATAFWPEGQPQKVANEFTTFERRIRTEVWGEGAAKIRHGEFKDARAALSWMKAEWPRVEGESFEPLDKEEAAAGQDLDALAALWERWSK